MEWTKSLKVEHGAAETRCHHPDGCLRVMGLRSILPWTVATMAMVAGVDINRDNGKELTPIILSCAVWGKLLWCQKFLFQCDNSSVVASIQKGSCKDSQVMHLLCILSFFTAYYDIELIAAHIPGVANATADHLSRNNLLLFFFLEPTGSTTPNPISTYITSHVDATVGGLDSNKLQDAVQEYFIKDLAWSTHKTYHAGQSRYLQFC